MLGSSAKVSEKSGKRPRVGKMSEFVLSGKFDCDSSTKCW